MNYLNLIRFGIVVATIVIAAACGERSKEKVSLDLSPTGIQVAETSKAKNREAVIDFTTIDLQVAIDHSSNVNWTVENINELAKKQLSKIGDLLSQRAPVSKEQYDDIVLPEYQGESLRPTRLNSVFEDSAFIVMRAEESKSETVHFDFLTSVQQLREPLDTTKPIRTNFKIVGAHVDDEKEANLDVLFELTGTSAGIPQCGLIQQRAKWETRWQRASDNRLLLSSIHVSDYEEACAKKSDSTHPIIPLLSDCTRSVLGNNSSYQEQLVPSTDHWIEQLEFRYGIDPGAWLGIAVADVNGDGFDDLYLCQPGGLPNRLYVQNEDGTATDVSADAGVDWMDHCHSALFVDLDNDADQDLVLALKRGLLILSNDGSGRFTVETIKPIPKSNPYALSAADFNLDGLLDLYVCCYSMRRNEKDHHFIQRPVPYHDANNGGRNVLLRNETNWSFKDVTNDVGLDENNRRFSFAASWEDFDNDGDVDLYVANDYGRNNLYQFEKGKFLDVAPSAGVEDISAGMSVDWSDFNNDGWMDLYVSNMFSSAGNRIAYQRQFRSADHGSTRQAFQRHARGNSLFQNLGDRTFKDISFDAGVTMGRWAWSSNFVDINNDGLEDLAVANGFITQEDTSDL